MTMVFAGMLTVLIPVILVIGLIIFATQKTRKKGDGGEKTKGSKPAKKFNFNWKWVWVPVLVFSLWRLMGGPYEKTNARCAAPAYQSFTLSPGDTVETVIAGPGKNFLLVSNKGYKAISVQKDGKERVYDMPVGRKMWIGAEPEGPVRLIGLTDGTLVKFYRL